MKYAIIAAIIAAVVVILLLLIENALANTDKNFIVVILVLLVITGGYFTIADLRKKNIEQGQQTEVQSNTLKNTVELNSKADSIIINLNKSLEKAILLRDNVNKFNTSLSKLEEDINTQVDILNKTLVQTKIFEQKVSEQLKIDKQRFSLEKAKLSIISQDVGFMESKKDTSQYSFYYWLRNTGKREAIEVKQRAVLIHMDKEEKIVYTWRTYELTNCDKIGGVDIKGACNFTSDLIIPKSKLFELYSNMLLVIKVTYQDENDKVDVTENFYFQWRGGTDTKELKFYQIRKEYKQLAIKYIRDNNIENILIE